MSLERNMRCGVGWCGHCQLGPLLVCRDGPVVGYDRAAAADERAGAVMGVPTLAVWKFASCDGCQLTLLDCEDELLAIAGQVKIAHFLEAIQRDVSRARTTCPWWRVRSPRRPTSSGSSGYARCRGRW